MPEEFKWCGTDFETRGKRMNECLEILRLIWGGGMVEYHGEHYDFGKIQMSPAPSKPIPIYIGGHTKPGLRRAAKYGDGWSSAMLPSKKLLSFVATTRGRCAGALVKVRCEAGSLPTRGGKAALG